MTLPQNDVLKKNSEKEFFLYHGSPEKNIELFEPRVSPGSSEKDGALVYATPDIATASIFMARVAGYWAVNIFDGVQCVILTMNRDDFIRNDHGGCIYVFSSDSFSKSPDSGMGELEWVSSKAVRPIKKIHTHLRLML